MEQQIVEQIADSYRERDEKNLVQTHISWIILSSDHAYKIKKPVKFSFLDFSTLSRRKYFCHRELLLNRRLAKEIYLEVLPVRQPNDVPMIGGNRGEIVDYAVKMKRLDLKHQMYNRLKERNVRNGEVEKIARKIAGFHQNAEVTVIPFQPEKLKDMFGDILQGRDFLSRLLGEKTGYVLENLVHRADEFINRHYAAFDKRHREGMVRDVHGDLHSGNIFLNDDPVIFDCIEFNNNFRRIDVLNEVAFFGMDMEFHEQPHLEKAFLKTYLDQFPVVRSKEEERLYAFYKLYRANVRAKVKVLKVQQYGPGNMPGAKNDLKRYMDLLSLYYKRLVTG